MSENTNLPPFINELRELEKEASVAPWEYSCGGISVHSGLVIAEIDQDNDENGDFIVALRNAFPSIVALAEENERLREIVEAGEEFEKSVEGMEVADFQGRMMTNGRDRWHEFEGENILNKIWRKERDEALRRYREAKGV